MQTNTEEPQTVVFSTDTTSTAMATKKLHTNN